MPLHPIERVRGEISAFLALGPHIHAEIFLSGAPSPFGDCENPDVIILLLPCQYSTLTIDLEAQSCGTYA